MFLRVITPTRIKGSVEQILFVPSGDEYDSVSMARRVFSPNAQGSHPSPLQFCASLLRQLPPNLRFSRSCRELKSEGVHLTGHFIFLRDLLLATIISIRLDRHLRPFGSGQEGLSCPWVGGKERVDDNRRGERRPDERNDEPLTSSTCLLHCLSILMIISHRSRR